jgi:zinc transporter ZupT
VSPVLVVFIYGSITALATGLGALPFAFVGRISDRWISYANAIASGLMLGASFGLVAEGSGHGRIETIVGANLGVLFIVATQRLLRRYPVEFGSLRGAGSQQMLLIVVVMTVHSISEGVAVGAAFGGGMELAFVITAAIAVHNIPEGLAISAVLRPRGVSVAGCAGWSIFSSLPQPLLAVPAFLFVDAFRPALPYGIGFAAGAMIFMVLVELLPDAYEHGRRAATAAIVTITMVAMMLFQQYL